MANVVLNLVEVLAKRVVALEGASREPGPAGASAYELWLNAGNEGSVEDFIAALQGAPGDSVKGDSVKGAPGASAYELWVQAGNEGSIEDFIASLQGEPGESIRGESTKGDDGAMGPMPSHRWDGTKLQFETEPGVWGAKVDLKGEDGDKGSTVVRQYFIDGEGGQNPNPGTGGGGSLSQPMKVVHQILNRANFTMGNNAFDGKFAAAGAMVPVVGEVPTEFGRVYPASLNAAPMRYYGAVPAMDGFGVRMTNSSWKTGIRAGIVGWAEFGLYGDEAILTLEAGYPYRIMVEEQGVDRYIDDTDITLASGTGAQLYRLTFPTRTRRIITIEANRETPVASNDEQRVGRIGAVYVKTADAVTFPNAHKSPKMCFIADSSMMGVNGPNGASCASIAAASLGIKDRLISCNFSTGALTSDGGLGALLWGQRRSDWQNFAPNILVFRLGIDFYNGEAALIEAVMLEVNAARAALPNCIIFVLGFIVQDPPWEFHVTANAGMQAALEALNDPFIRYLDQGTAPSTYWLEVGTGKIGATVADGPRSMMVGFNEHWSREGDEMHGAFLAQVFRQGLEDIYYGADIADETPVDEPATIVPTSGSITLTVGVPVNTLLGTIAGGAPSGTPSGTAPAGCEFVTVGQQLRITGTPTTEGAISVTVGVTTDDGDVTYALSGSVQPDVVEPEPGDWTPAAITSAYAWAEADDVANTTDSGDTSRVSQLADLSGKGHHFTPSLRLSGTPSELYFQKFGTENGRATLNTWSSYKGFFDFGDGNFARNKAGVTLARVWKYGGGAHDPGFLTLMVANIAGGAFARAALSVVGGVPQAGGRRLDGDAYGSVDSGGGVLALDRPAIMIAIFDYSTRTIRLRVNGTEYVASSLWTGVGSTSDTEGLSNNVGHQEAGTPGYGLQHGWFAADAAISTGDAQKLEGFWADGWGLRADLPSDHPYKSSLP